jgi:hypothetical protein
MKFDNKRYTRREKGGMAYCETLTRDWTAELDLKSENYQVG